jgi:hypothetical protein
MSKSKSIKIEGVQFSLPFKMKKTRFVKMFGGHFGEKTNSVFEKLNKSK